MNKQYQEQRFEEQGIKLCKAMGIDEQTIDFESLWDSALSYQENKRILFDYIKQLKGDYEYNKERNKAQLEDYIEQVRNNLMEKEYQPTDTEHLYDNLYKAVEKLTSPYGSCVIVKGVAGIGKTHHIQNALAKNNSEYVVISDSTQAYLPKILWDNNGKTIWFKDVGYKLLRGIDTIETLKAITETDPKMRIVSNYNFNPAKKDIPETFIFTGRLVMDFNRVVELRYLDNYQALLSRCDVIDLMFSHKEIAGLMRSIAKTDVEKEVTEYLIENYNHIGINSFNLRTQQNAFNDYKFCIEKNYDWKEYILNRIQQNRSPIFNLLYQFLGREAKRTTELKKWLIANQNLTIRTAERRIKEWIEIDELYNLEPMRERDFMVSLYPSDTISISDKKEGIV